MGIKEYIIILILIFIAFIIGFLIGKIQKYLDIKKSNHSAIKKSRSVLIGNMTEQLAPLLPNFKYTPKDMMFLGKGVDYIVFEGLSVGKLEKIIFLEIKTGKSQLNKNERAIKNAVLSGKVSYEVYRKYK